MELGVCSLKSGTNYLAQAAAPRALTVPAAEGFALIRTTDGEQQAKAQAFDENDTSNTILAVACAPASPDLVALAHSTQNALEIWQLASRCSSEAPKLASTIHLGGACRCLIWHPHRRILSATLPDRVVILDVGAMVSRGGEPTCHELQLPERCSGAVLCAAWGSTGSVLAVAWYAAASLECCNGTRLPIPMRNVACRV